MNRLAFLLAEGLKNLWRNKMTALATVAILVIVLVSSGVLLMGQSNSSILIEYLRSKYKIEVFLESSVNENIAREITGVIRALPKVRSVTLNTQSDALKIFERQFGEDVEEMLGYNPLPASCVINIERENFSEDDVDALIRRIKEIPGIDEVYYQGRLIKRVERTFAQGLRVLAAAVGVFIIVAAILIYFTIQLSVQSRRDLIRTLQLNGASRTFIKIPFILEGLFQGWIATGISIGILVALIRTSQSFLETFRIHVIVDWNIAIILFTLSTVIALVAGHRAISRHLK